MAPVHEDEDDDVSETKQGHAPVHNKQWFEGGLFRKARLRADDKEFASKLSSHEAFFNVIFAAACTNLSPQHTVATVDALLSCCPDGYAKLDSYLVFDRDPYLFCLYFLAWYSAYKTGAEYALRYNDTDLTHKIFWSIYGFCCMGMLIHTSGGLIGASPLLPFPCLFHSPASSAFP